MRCGTQRFGLAAAGLLLGLGRISWRSPGRRPAGGLAPQWPGKQPDGRTLYASGAGQEVRRAVAFQDGYLGTRRLLRVRDRRQRGVPSGLAVNPDGQRL